MDNELRYQIEKIFYRLSQEGGIESLSEEDVQNFDDFITSHYRVSFSRALEMYYATLKDRRLKDDYRVNDIFQLIRICYKLWKEGIETIRRTNILWIFEITNKKLEEKIREREAGMFQK